MMNFDSVFIALPAEEKKAISFESCDWNENVSEQFDST